MNLHHEPVDSEKIDPKSGNLIILKLVNIDHSYSPSYNLLNRRAAVCAHPKGSSMSSSGDAQQGHIHLAFKTSSVYAYVNVIIHERCPGLSV